jgi:hypothetical protein
MGVQTLKSLAIACSHVCMLCLLYHTLITTRCSPPSYQEYSAQELPYKYIAPALPPPDLPQEFASDAPSTARADELHAGLPLPADRTKASSVKVVSGSFEGIGAPAQTLHSDVTGETKNAVLANRFTEAQSPWFNRF